jgi:hypothetical protein
MFIRRVVRRERDLNQRFKLPTFGVSSGSEPKVWSFGLASDKASGAFT